MRQGGAGKGRFELLYGFVHCRGRTSYSAGYVETKEEADRWVRDHREGLARTPAIPPDDPVRCCKAALCPLKRQKLWYSAVAAQGTPAATGETGSGGRTGAGRQKGW